MNTLGGNIRFSVIVPIYNIRRDYLECCIKSITGQDYEDIELILVNDGSVNEVPAVCSFYAGSDSRIVYITQENRGVSAARNNGIEHATGDYIVFADGDDFLSDGCLRHLAERIAEKNFPDLLFFGYFTSYSTREMRRVLDKPDMSVFEAQALQLAVLQGDERLGPIEVGAPWGKAIRRDVITDNALRYQVGLKKGQDTVFTLNLLEYCASIDYLPFAGYHYRMSTSSISHRYNPDIVDIMEKTLGAYEEFAAHSSKGDVFKKAIAGKYYKVILGEYCELYFMHPKNPDSFKEMCGKLRNIIMRQPYRDALDMVDEKGLPLLERFEVSSLKAGRFRVLMIEKRLVGFLRGLIIRNYE